MADIRPFQGVHYSKSAIDDWSSVICPPYDIISPQHQEELYQSNPYNFIRLESGRNLPQDTPSDNKYTRAVATMEQWLEQGVLDVTRSHPFICMTIISIIEKKSINDVVFLSASDWRSGIKK